MKGYLLQIGLIPPWNPIIGTYSLSKLSLITEPPVASGHVLIAYDCAC